MKENTDEIIIEFKPFSIWLKAFNFLLAVCILGSNIAGFKDNSYSIVAVLIGCVCLFAAGRQNKWVFNITKRKILNISGFLFFCRKKEYGFSETADIFINKFKRSGKSAEYTEIVIQFKDGVTKIIESDKTKKLEKAIAKAEELQSAFQANSF